jgi:putative hydrolase
MLQQIGAMMQQAEGEGDENISWKTIHDSARNSISQKGDPSITENQKTSVRDAISLAQVWLDEATAFPASNPNFGAWSKSEWLENTLPAWRPLIEPVAKGLAETMSSMSTDMQGLVGNEEVPAEMQKMLQPMLEMAKKMAAVSTGMQIGQGLAELSTEMLGASDISLPLAPNNTPSLLPNYITKFAADYELPVSEVMMMCAVREAALCRLYAAQPWVGKELVETVARYAAVISIDKDRIREVMENVDPSNPESMQELMAAGVFEPATTEAQQKALNHLEFMLALIEGWVSYTSELVIENRLENAGRLIETMNRRRASGGPAEKTFSNLVGLELRPRLIRDATTFWKYIHANRVEINSVWSHLDFLPDRDDLGNPSLYVEKRTAE